MRYSDTLRAIVEDVPIKFKLTNREEEVFELIVQGLTNPEIAAELRVTPSTASSTTDRILQKMRLTGGRAAILLHLLEELDSEVMKAEARIAEELERRGNDAHTSKR